LLVKAQSRTMKQIEQIRYNRTIEHSSTNTIIQIPTKCKSSEPWGRTKPSRLMIVVQSLTEFQVLKTQC
jgi:hypothetical protein